MGSDMFFGSLDDPLFGPLQPKGGQASVFVATRIDPNAVSS
jgi:hypothetical protein